MINTELVKIAKEINAFEFPSKAALDKYLKEHPKADKSNHSVMNQKQKSKIKQTVKNKNPQKVNSWLDNYKENLKKDIKEGFVKKDSRVFKKHIQAILLIKQGKREEAYDLLSEMDSSQKDTIPAALYNWIQR